jgi:hypothetical protein
MIYKFKLILENCWSVDTCHPDFKDKWNDNNRCIGQCAITSLIINDYFGGEIRKCYVGDISHYFNFINGEVIDLTSEQFNIDYINYDNYLERSREQLLANEDTKGRYEILNKRVLAYIKEIGNNINDKEGAYHIEKKK